MNTRNVYSAEFKAQIAMLAIWQTYTMSEICSKYSLHSTQVSKWKKDLQDRSKEIFENKRKNDIELVEKEKELDKIYKQIWKLTVENDWLKKKYDQFIIWN